MKKIARINSTPQVIQACICIIRSILQVTQRVPPTCTIIHISPGTGQLDPGAKTKDGPQGTKQQPPPTDVFPPFDVVNLVVFVVPTLHVHHDDDPGVPLHKESDEE